MSLFRSPLARRIFYAIILALALVRVATRLHSEPLSAELAPGGSHNSGIVAHMVN